jgi:hypothetical protein
MTISSSNLNPKLSKPSIPEINLVATSQLSPEHFVRSNRLEFTSSSDDVGSLVFSAFSLPSGNSISLVHYLDAPYPGVQVYIAPDSSSPSEILSEALNFLNLSPTDLDWIHPQINLPDSV